MKIVDVTGYLLPKTPPPVVFRWRAGLPGSNRFDEIAILRIETDAGIDGYSEIRRGRIGIDIIERRLKDLLVGQDPLLKEDLWKKVWELDRIEELPLYMLGTIDVALWDITAKAAGLPLYQLLGGFRNQIPAYASTVTFDSIEEYFVAADQSLELGYQAIKLHAWGDPHQDAELAIKLRRHVGDDIQLMYDGSAGFDYQDALYLGRALEEAGFLWYEEPMREFSIASYRRLREKLSIPLLVAETSDGCHYNTADFIKFDAGDMVRTSAELKGGITGAMRIAHLADAFQLRAEVHGGGLPNLHLACAIPNTTYYESLVFENPVKREALVGPDGMVHVPTAPGIGWSWTEADLAKRASKVV